MSATIHAQTTATDINLVRRMASRLGWTVREYQSRVQISVDPQKPYLRLWLDLTTGRLSRDSDYAELEEVANDFNQEYAVTGLVAAAETNGYDYTLRQQEDGQVVVSIEVPENQFEVQL